MIRCKTCKQPIENDKIICYNGKDVYFCEQCFTSFLITEKEQEERNFLYKTICRIFGINKMTGKLFAEVKRVMEQENLTYKNLTNVLHYMYDIKKIPVYSPTLYYVPHNIKEAKEYYHSIKEREIKAAEAFKKQAQLSPKVVKPNYNRINKRASGLKINPNDV